VYQKDNLILLCHFSLIQRHFEVFQYSITIPFQPFTLPHQPITLTSFYQTLSSTLLRLFSNMKRTNANKVMKNSKSITVKVYTSNTLPNHVVEQMCEIYLAGHRISREKCEERIRSGFDRMAVFFSVVSGKVVGFNGIRLTRHKGMGFGRPILAAYLGQMYVEKAYRGQNPIQMAMAHTMFRFKLLTPWQKTIIWGDTITYKPYMLIANNSDIFFPRPEVETPQNYQNLIDDLGVSHYDDRYMPETGCVRKDSTLVMEAEAPIPARFLANRFIKFYTERNSGYQQGNGMIILMSFTWKAWMKLIKKVYANRWKALFPKVKINTAGLMYLFFKERYFVI